MKNNILFSEDFIFFTTREYASANSVSVAAASKQLHRLKKNKIIERVTRGLWANISHPYFNPLGAVPYLLAIEQGYISFLTAMHLTGIISQIPHTIQIATTGHSRTLSTPIGKFEFFQLKPEMMREGVNWTESKTPYRMATPEKALVDTLYLSTRKGRRFASLPEVEYKFDLKTLKSLLNQIKFIKIKKSVSQKIKLLYSPDI